MTKSKFSRVLVALFSPVTILAVSVGAIPTALANENAALSEAPSTPGLLHSRGLKPTPASQTSTKAAPSTLDSAWNNYFDDKYDACIADCTAVIAQNPKDGDAYALRGYAKTFKNDYVGALADGYQASLLSPTSGFPPLVMAHAWMGLPDYKPMVAHATRAIEKKMTGTYLTEAYFLRGRGNEETGEIANALRDYTFANELDPTWTQPLWYRCWVYSDLGLNRSFLLDADALVKLNAKNADFQRALGYALKANGRKQDAVAAFQRARDYYQANNLPDWAKKMDNEVKQLQTTASAG